MSSLKDGIPSWPKLLADFKISKDNWSQAVAESQKYCLTIINGCHYNYPMLIMPCCSEMFELYYAFLSFPHNKWSSLR